MQIQACTEIFNSPARYTDDLHWLYAERAGAYMARKDYALALADFDRALFEAPDNSALIFGKAIDMPVMIGVVLLLGISAKNAILLVEFAIESEQRGNNVYDALFDACRERARPIVMTTVAMSAGMLPTALGLGEGAGFRTSMAIAVIGGLFSSTVLTLVLAPVIYSLVSSVERRVNPLFGRLVTKRTVEDDALLASGGDLSQPHTPTRPAE